MAESLIEVRHVSNWFCSIQAEEEETRHDGQCGTDAMVRFVWTDA